MDIAKLFLRGIPLKTAFAECLECMDQVYAEAKDIVRCPPGTPSNFRVTCQGAPSQMRAVGGNLFSTLFHSVYVLLDIPKSRRMLYGQLNYLFRIWVTSADNLLDNEDKAVMAITIPGDSRVMRQVVQVMAADRMMVRVLNRAVADGLLSAKDAQVLEDETLRVLLPSAAEEASEEGGVRRRPKPEEVLKDIHRLKTCLLFRVPLLGPELIEKEIDPAALKDFQEGLEDFGLGCQVLDDIRDMARDHLEARHNYLLSRIVWEDKKSALRLKKEMPRMRVDSKIFAHFRPLVEDSARLADDLLYSGLMRVNSRGLGLPESIVRMIVDQMYAALDVKEVLAWSRHR